MDYKRQVYQDIFNLRLECSECDDQFSSILCCKECGELCCHNCGQFNHRQVCHWCQKTSEPLGETVTKSIPNQCPDT